MLRLDRWVLDRRDRGRWPPRAPGPAGCGWRSTSRPGPWRTTTWAAGSWTCSSAPTSSRDRLGLEITETTAITNLDAARRLVSRLTEAGCGFALDDFGAGFGSFSHLKHLPFTAVKIAGEFVRQLDPDRVDRALVAAVVGVARELGMRTVAEQVDRPQLVQLLRGLGVSDGQGFHLGRPRPLADLLG